MYPPFETRSLISQILVRVTKACNMTEVPVPPSSGFRLLEMTAETALWSGTCLQLCESLKLPCPFISIARKC